MKPTQSETLTHSVTERDRDTVSQLVRSHRHTQTETHTARETHTQTRTHTHTHSHTHTHTHTDTHKHREKIGRGDVVLRDIF